MSPRELFLWLLLILGGFLLGGIMFCRSIPQWFLHIDICETSDDHNPGASNVFQQCGAGWGLLCLALDVFKGWLPVMLACRMVALHHPLFALVLSAPVLGHALAPFYHFHGGKCIATAFGVLLALFPYNRIGILLALFYILFSTILKIRPNRLRSIVTFLLFGVLSGLILIVRHNYAIALGCILISLIAIFKHSVFVANRTREAYSK